MQDGVCRLTQLFSWCNGYDPCIKLQCNIPRGYWDMDYSVVACKTLTRIFKWRNKEP